MTDIKTIVGTVETKLETLWNVRVRVLTNFYKKCDELQVLGLLSALPHALPDAERMNLKTRPCPSILIATV